MFSILFEKCANSVEGFTLFIRHLFTPWSFFNPVAKLSPLRYIHPLFKYIHPAFNPVRGSMEDANSYRYVSESDLKSRFSASDPWPFAKMKVGQVVELCDSGRLESAVNAYHYLAKKHGWRFKRKTIDGVVYVKRIS